MNLNKSFQQFIAEFKAVDGKKLRVTGVVGSDDSIDRHGDRINPEGWDLDNYRKSPVILLNHDYHSLPIGKAENVRIEENKLLFDIDFSETYDLAKTVYNLVKEGIMKAVSVGFLVKEWGKAGSSFTIEAAELLELSFVTVPANPNALTQDQLGLVEAFTKSLAEAEADKPEALPGEEYQAKFEELTGTIKELTDKLNTLETKMGEVVDEKIAELTHQTITNTESDEAIADDPVLTALTALGQELKEQNQGSGKALKSLNQLLESIKE